MARCIERDENETNIHYVFFPQETEQMKKVGINNSYVAELVMKTWGPDKFNKNWLKYDRLKDEYYPKLKKIKTRRRHPDEYKRLYEKQKIIRETKDPIWDKIAKEEGKQVVKLLKTENEINRKFNKSSLLDPYYPPETFSEELEGVKSYFMNNENVFSDHWLIPLQADRNTIVLKESETQSEDDEQYWQVLFSSVHNFDIENTFLPRGEAIEFENTYHRRNQRIRQSENATNSSTPILNGYHPR